ncbi:CopG family transcriptional regulator [Novosphingobium album (ex Liu et al. 2023)]|uniref:CopG family transcriptional regulator n=1 Tax=Novosphingobium album (ex Liu et al. 2023) TaxID=3031130 RepID=A0ABT5WQ06_9SPHN|nr:CopG family transcriptional regulator [Novosphingobium album (ex Liu et al. 2023)]MDE8652127.1 CopG family transcriptional regulator [Novosphingobium album (ex Liu et al. 2023)]
MTKLNIRVDEALYARLARRAHGAGLPVSTFCRSVLTQAADPQHRYVYSSQDEILATALQMLSILATFVGQQSPKALEQGMADARAILAERGLVPEGARP